MFALYGIDFDNKNAKQIINREKWVTYAYVRMHVCVQKNVNLQWQQMPSLQRSKHLTIETICLAHIH